MHRLDIKRVIAIAMSIVLILIYVDIYSCNYNRSYLALSIAIVIYGSYIGYRYYKNIIIFILIISCIYPITPALMFLLTDGAVMYSNVGFQSVSMKTIIGAIFVASLCFFYFVLIITKRKGAKITITNRVANRTAQNIGLLGMLIAAYLSEPSFNYLFFTDVLYEDMYLQRIDSIPFISGVWVVCTGLCMYYYSSSGDRHKKIYWLIFVATTMHLLLHGRRAEVLGTLFAVMLVLYYQGNRKVNYYSVIVVMLFSFVGAFRNSGIENISNYMNHVLDRGYYSFPGGVGNVLSGYIVAYDSYIGNTINMMYGESYINHILRLPPKLLGADRPLTTYDILDQKASLIGGEYYLIEPLLNFGSLGLVMFIFLLGHAFRKAINGLAASNIIYYILSFQFIGIFYRTAWYGIGALIKTSLMALVIGVLIFVIQYSVRKRQLLVPKNRQLANLSVLDGQVNVYREHN